MQLVNFLNPYCWAQSSHTPPQDSRLSENQLQAKLASDRAALERYRQGLQKLILFAGSRPDIFPAKKNDDKRLLQEQDKMVVRDNIEYLLS